MINELTRGKSRALEVKLQKLVSELYEQLGYDYFINYSAPPPPPWSESDVAQWLHDSH